MSSTPTALPRRQSAHRLRNPLRQRYAPPDDPISARSLVPPLSPRFHAPAAAVRSISGADINWLFSTMRMAGNRTIGDRRGQSTRRLILGVRLCRANFSSS